MSPSRIHPSQSTAIRSPKLSTDTSRLVGIVRGYEAALELVEEIAGKVYEQTGAADIRSYLLEREQEG